MRILTTGIVLVLFLALGVWLFATRARTSKKRGVIAVLACTVLSAVLHLFPLENAFFTFASAEDALHYCNTGEIIAVAEQEASYMVLYQAGPGTISHMIARKSNGGYKIGTSLDYQTVGTGTADGFHMEVLHAVGTEEYYTFVTGVTQDADTAISDSEQSVFRKAGVEQSGYTFVYAIAAVNGWDADYSVLINGKPYPFDG